MLLKVAIALFIIGAVFGLIVLTAVLTNRETPKPTVLFHGLFVVTGVTLVLIAFLTSQENKLLTISLGLFVLAALGGLTMLVTDLLKKPIPKALAVLHPLVAVLGLICLIVYVLPTL